MRRPFASLLVFLLAIASIAPLILLASPAATAQAARPVLNLFFSSKRRGEIENCNCQSVAQGGVAFEPVLYAQHGRGRPELRVDAGDWMDGLAATHPVRAEQSRYLLRALELLKYDVVNFSLRDAQLSHGWIEHLAQSHPGAVAPLVSANVYRLDQPDQLAFPPWRIVERQLADGKTYKIGVIGVTSVEGALPGMETVEGTPDIKTAGYIVRPPQERLGAALAELAPQVDMLLVLHAGTYNEARQLAQRYPQMRFMVTTAMAPRGVGVYFFEGPVAMMFSEIESGRKLGMAALRPRERNWEFELRPHSFDVVPTPNVDPALTALVEDFKQRSTAGLKPFDPRGVRAFAGAHRCYQCHDQIYQSWRNDPHSRAMQRLVVEGEQFNPEHLRRATTGFGQLGGFVHPSQHQSQMLMGVQCESCHGAAFEHASIQHRLANEPNLAPAERGELEQKARQAMPAKVVPEATCLQCHGPQDDPGFNFERDYERVRHLK